ncbi:MAG: carboxylating nicotinate-nucleotide diphosphorylase [Akkermansiaceae bacterium]|jgi:nicotinate-nucleotide pyrophosphorylase (carboxylating)|nr:carboxylating nicotinate-nucleotide diphosphorylase [Akkermansiaceae bacterium]
MNHPTDLLIELAMAEDIGGGDVTTRYFIPEDRQANAWVVARKDGVVSGGEIAAQVFRKVDPELLVQILTSDGTHVVAGSQLIRIQGSARSILTAERTALNFLQHLSGIATLTAYYCKQVLGTHTRILDTRKTTPGYRMLEKKAVRDGGGTNHRQGLYDRAMVKDNHLVAEGGIAAIQAGIKKLKINQPNVEVEIEADSIEQVREFLALDGVDYILLDNMTLVQLSEAVALRGLRTKPMLEASGGITLELLAEIAATGVDFISVGALTHSAPALDIGLDFQSI